jgi:hypothetical protein
MERGGPVLAVHAVIEARPAQASARAKAAAPERAARPRGHDVRMRLRAVVRLEVAGTETL